MAWIETAFTVGLSEHAHTKTMSH